MLKSCVKHNNSHREMKSGTSSVRHVSMSVVKSFDQISTWRFVKISAVMTSTIGQIPSTSKNERKSYWQSFKLWVSPKSNFSRTIPSWERKLEIDFIPSTVMQLSEKCSTKKCWWILKYPNIQFFQWFALFQSFSKINTTFISKIVVACLMLKSKFAFILKPKCNSSITIPSWERKLEIDFTPSAVMSQPERWSTARFWLKKYGK